MLFLPTVETVTPPQDVVEAMGVEPMSDAAYLLQHEVKDNTGVDMGLRHVE
jgi:hypothetical protein